MWVPVLEKKMMWSLIASCTLLYYRKQLFGGRGGGRGGGIENLRMLAFSVQAGCEIKNHVFSLGQVPWRDRVPGSDVL